MKKLVVLNHKMSLLYDDLYNYIELVNGIDTDNDIIICPSYIYLEAFVNNSYFPVGAQDIHYSLDEKHTGEISSDQLKSLGIEYTIVGHYEKDFDNGNIINQKLIAALDANIFPILCFGENIDEDYRDILPKQLDSYLKDIDNIDFITFAYEPIYAIGTGALPNINKIKEIISFVSEYLEGKYHKKPTLLYGGSVDSGNISDIINIDNLSGVMLGSISSDIKEVFKIFKNIQNEKYVNISLFFEDNGIIRHIQHDFGSTMLT